MSQTQVSKKYDPYAIRRCVRFQGETNDGIATFKTKSFTDPTAAEEWHPSIDLVTGAFECDCPDWRYRKSKTNTPCKHIARALDNCKRHGIDL